MVGLGLVVVVAAAHAAGCEAPLCSDDIRDGQSHLFRILMLPNSNRRPSRLFERPVGIGVAALIGPDLCPPPLCILLRPSAVLGTAVPEAAIYEDRNLMSREGDIGTSARDRQGIVNAEPQSSTMEKRPNSDLRGCISLSLRRHPT
jgi:hypothetical protein